MARLAVTPCIYKPYKTIHAFKSVYGFLKPLAEFIIILGLQVMRYVNKNHKFVTHTSALRRDRGVMRYGRDKLRTAW